MPDTQKRKMTRWEPSLGAWITPGGVRFRVWAPEARSIDLTLPCVKTPASVHPLRSTGDGYFSGVFPDISTGTRYQFRIDGDASYPDPASRFQPEGVHGPSEIVDPSVFSWTDDNWVGVSMEDLILYELHVGTFSSSGTFNGVRERLKTLHDLGVTAIELMPVADFPGNRNWGYDGVDLFAPARCYGTPDDLRHLVNEAHALGIGVVLDVVYNHLGPDGAYLGAFSPYYFSSTHKGPWGDAVNFDDEHCRPARDFFIENALHWIHEYHIDGLRLDATHAIVDDSPTHFLKELAQKVLASLSEEQNVLLIAEDDRNQAQLVLSTDRGGYGLDGVWADDFHHQVRCLLTGDNEGYFQDFSGKVEDLSKTLRQGWFFTGQNSVFRKGPRGTPTEGIPLHRFVHCIQNHDQVGNRAMGDRLHFKVDLASFRAVSTLLLLSPATPLIFMGQEWGASTPFCYFTDHEEALGKAVTAGRRKEFCSFKAFSEPNSILSIPDPQALSTFVNSQLNWEERHLEPHTGILNLYRELIKLRRTEPALMRKIDSSLELVVLGENFLAVRRATSDASAILMVVCLKGQGKTIIETCSVNQPPQGKQWALLQTTEDPDFTNTPSRPLVTVEKENITLDFQGPATVLFRSITPE
jgi:maltooligosyltrehalose trehalohydrolase